MRFCRASSIDEALTHLQEWGSEGRLLAGGTDLMVQYNSGEIAPSALIHIEGIDGLSGITTNGRTKIGALTTHSALNEDNGIGAHHPALAHAAGLVGGWQTQAVGTIGGNICNASPAADLLPPLLIADANVTLASAAGERRLALDDFVVDPNRTTRNPEELLRAVDLEPLPHGSSECYVKLGRRGAMDVAVVGLALRLSVDGDNTVTSARVAVCSVAPTARRMPEAEALLTGSRLEPDAIRAAGDALKHAVSPIDDGRATASYRRRVLPGLLARAAECCVEEAGA